MQVRFLPGVPLASNPNATLIVKAIGEGFGLLLWLDLNDISHDKGTHLAELPEVRLFNCSLSFLVFWCPGV